LVIAWGSLTLDFGKSSLYIIFWQLLKPIHNKKYLFIPSLLKNKQTDNLLKFRGEINYCYGKKATF
tara:strand:+ start:228 stop:425 length:198 start_codon:yes stop_codon:yes gene_type:complete